MKKIIALILLSLFLASCKKAPEIPNIAPDLLPMNDYYKSRLTLFDTYKHEDIAMIGDSLTAEGDWEHLLAPDVFRVGSDAPVKDVEVTRNILNFGIKSDNSISLIMRLDQLIKVKPKICFVLIGTNQYKNDFLFNDLLAIRSRLISHGIHPFLTTIPYKSEIDTEYSHNNKDTKIFNERIRKSGFEYIDLNAVTQKKGILDESLTADGVHLNAEGYRRWSALIKEKLNA